MPFQQELMVQVRNLASESCNCKPLRIIRIQTGVFPGLKTPEEMFSNWTGDADYMLRDFNNGVMTVTFHPQVSGRGHRLLGMEKWIDAMLDQGLQFSVMGDIAMRFKDGASYGVYRPE